jgi:hypothetical protein
MTNEATSTRGVATTRRRQKQLPGRGTLILVVAFVLASTPAVVQSYQLLPSVTKWGNQVREGYKCRVAADPSFRQKSFTEVLLAAGAQFAAEWNRRGANRLVPEADFVLPAILTAVFGKYYR